MLIVRAWHHSIFIDKIYASCGRGTACRAPGGAERGGERALVPLLLAVARDVARLAAHVARLGAVGAVARDVARLVAVVARLVGVIAPALGAVPRDVPGLVAVVARRLVGTLRALAGYVSRAVTSAT